MALMTLTQFLEEMKKPRVPKKASCGHVLDLMDKEGNYTRGGEQICGDCYFEAISEEIDKHPIGRPTPHGGCC